MLCHGKPLLCGKKSKNSSPLTSEGGNESEGEDMYGFLPKKTSMPTSPLAVRRENIYVKCPGAARRPARRVTFKEEPPRVRLIQRRHSCAENFRSFAARRYEYQPLIPIEQLPTYPNAARRSSATSSAAPTSTYRQEGAREGCSRPSPPSYQVAVRRAASFSAKRGVNREYMVRRPPPPPPPCPNLDNHSCSPMMSQIPPPMPLLSRQFSSSTSDLYVDALALKHGCALQQSRDQGRDGSTSTLSEATVYRRVGPRDYVSVNEKSRRVKCLSSTSTTVSSSSSSEDDGVDMNSSATDIENLDHSQTDSTGSDFQCNDSYRFSMANLEDTQDVDLDAMLVELCALESQYKSSRPTSNVMRTESPDNDSAFSDSVSLLSSESSTSSSTTPSTHNQITRTEDSKAEKIKLALQKMKEANVKKLFIKVFDKDGGAKSLMVDENMKCGYVTKLLADKHHRPVSPRWGLVEYLAELYMERVYEEHEPLVENLMMWTRDSKNKLYYVERPDRTLMFQRQEVYYSEQQGSISVVEQSSQSTLLEEYLNNKDSFCIENPLYIKVDSKKGWKKYNAILRASGLYYYKEKTKSTGDLECLATFEVNQVYYGVGWKKKFKAPTEHCFAIKHPCLQQAKSTKYIKYLCAEDEATLHKWVTAIRLIKYGRQLVDNYQSQITVDDSELLSDSGSSGCDVAFESDFPCGTIKRKPPKLPLTATTRQLASLDRSLERRTSSTSTLSELPPPPPELLASTLTLNEDPLDLPPPPPPPRLLPPLNSDFATRLQRVMRSKWQVAQKCKLDSNVTPHEVLGFRDPPSDYRETNVSNWVAEHYGGVGQNLYENVHHRSGMPSSAPPTGVTPAKVPTVPAAAATTTPVKKRPPPPPPPRAETTQLTTTSVIPRFQKF